MDTHGKSKEVVNMKWRKKGIVASEEEVEM
jgi:hypothetical protein